MNELEASDDGVCVTGNDLQQGYTEIVQHPCCPFLSSPTRRPCVATKRGTTGLQLWGRQAPLRQEVRHWAPPELLGELVTWRLADRRHLLQPASARRMEVDETPSIRSHETNLNCIYEAVSLSA